MNLENKPSDGGDYKSDDFDESAEDTIDREIQHNTDAKMHRILAELSDLRSDVAEKVARRNATAAPQKKEANPEEGDAVMTELSRLREETSRAQTTQEIRAQLSQMKEELTREIGLRAGSGASAPASDATLLMEVRRISDRIDSLERGWSVPAYALPRDAYAPPVPSYAPAEQTAEQITDYHGITKALDDVNTKLERLDTQLSELSLIATANDISPLACELLDIKSKLGNMVSGAKNADSESGFEITDKFLDELVRLQSSVEDVKKSVDDLSSQRITGYGVTETDQTERSDTSAARQAQILEVLRSETADGLNALNEQISSLHADLKIYAEEGVADRAESVSGGDASQPAASDMRDKLSALQKDIDFLTIQSSETKPGFEEMLAILQDLHENGLSQRQDFDRAAFETIASELQQLRAQAILSGPSADQEAADSARMDAIKASVEQILPTVQQDLLSIQDAVTMLATQESPADITPSVEAGFAEIKALLEALAAQLKPVDLSPVVNTIAAIAARPIQNEDQREPTAVSERAVDLEPVLGAVVRLDAKLEPVVRLESKLDAVLQEQETHYEQNTTGFAADSGVVTRITDTVSRLETKLDAVRQALAAQQSQSLKSAYGSVVTPTVDLSSVTEAVSRLESKLEALRLAQPAMPAAGQDSRELCDAMMRLDAKLESVRQTAARPVASAPGVDNVSFNEAINRLDAKLESIRQKQNLSGISTTSGDSAALRDSMARLDAKLEAVRQAQTTYYESGNGYNNGLAAAETRALSDTLSRVEAKLDLVLRKADAARPADNAEVLAAVASLRTGQSSDRDVIDAISTLRREVASLAASGAVAASRMPITSGSAEIDDTSALRRIVKEELAAFERPVIYSISERESTRAPAELTAVAEPKCAPVKRVKKAAVKPAATRTSTKPVVKTKPVAKPATASSAEKTKNASAAKKPTATKSAKLAVKNSTASKSNKPAAKKPPQKPLKNATRKTTESTAKKSISTPVAKKTIRRLSSAPAPELLPADSIARQIALKLVLEQLLIEPQTTKARKRKVLEKVRESELADSELKPTPESIKQHANRLVLERLFSEVDEE